MCFYTRKVKQRLVFLTKSQKQLQQNRLYDQQNKDYSLANLVKSKEKLICKSAKSRLAQLFIRAQACFFGIISLLCRRTLIVKTRIRFCFKRQLFQILPFLCAEGFSSLAPNTNHYETIHQVIFFHGVIKH